MNYLVTPPRHVVVKSAYWAETSMQHLFCTLAGVTGNDIHCWCYVENEKVCPFRDVAIELANPPN